MSFLTKIHTALIDNGTHYTDPTGQGWTVAEIREMLARKEIFRCQSFDLACAQNDIDHRLTKLSHSWTNGQAEPLANVSGRTISDAGRKI